MNATLATLELQTGYWRLSPFSRGIEKCAVAEADAADAAMVSPCIGGLGDAPSAYCNNETSGLLCSICDAPGTFFDTAGARCESCPSVVPVIATTVVLICILVLLVQGLKMLAAR